MPTANQLNLVLLGDVMLGDLPRSDVHQEGITAIRRAFWGPVGNADLVVMNLESPLTTAQLPGKDKRFLYRSHPTAAHVFDSRCVIGLANNHIMDFGQQGLEETLQVLENEKCSYAGAGKDLCEAQRPAVLEVKGSRVAVLCAADPRFDPAGRNCAGTFPAQARLLTNEVVRLRQEVDLVLVSLHMGLEYTGFPTPRMHHLAKTCVTAGADLVQFHHAHKVSGTSRLGSGIVVWGSGNYWLRSENMGSRGFFSGGIWRGTWDSKARSFVSSTLEPVLKDEHGLPQSREGGKHHLVQAQINRWSGRIVTGRGLGRGLLLSLLHPIFLKTSLSNYLDMMRRNGGREVWASLRSTLRQQFSGCRR